MTRNHDTRKEAQITSFCSSPNCFRMLVSYSLQKVSHAKEVCDPPVRADTPSRKSRDCLRAALTSLTSLSYLDMGWEVCKAFYTIPWCWKSNNYNSYSAGWVTTSGIRAALSLVSRLPTEMPTMELRRMETELLHSWA